MDFSASSIARGFSGPSGTNMAKYAANHFNDPFYSLLNDVVGTFTLGCCILSERRDFSPKQQILEPIYEEIYQLLKNRSENDTELHNNPMSSSFDLTIKRESDGIEFEVHRNGKITKEFIPGMDFDRMEDVLLSCRPINLTKLDGSQDDVNEVIAQLCHPSRTLPTISFDTDGNNKVLPKIEKQPRLGGTDSVTIFAGTTFHGFNGKYTTTSSDSATVTFTNNMFAATAVDGCNFTAKAENSKIYSALITAAALRTAQAFKNNEITNEQVQEYFYTTLKKYESSAQFIEDEERGVTFSGIVLFRLKDGSMQQLHFGLGDTALASVHANGATETLHLQDDFAPLPFSIAPDTPALGPGYKRVNQTHVTAKITHVNPTTKTVQIMTDGCAPAYFEPRHVAGTENTPAKARCKNALGPKNTFNAKVLTDIVNEDQSALAEKTKTTVLTEFTSFRQSQVAQWQTTMSEYDEEWRELATEEGQRNYAEKFEKKGMPIPTIDEVTQAIVEDDLHSQKIERAFTDAQEKKGDDVLHLSIDVRQAFEELDRRAEYIQPSCDFVIQNAEYKEPSWQNPMDFETHNTTSTSSTTHPNKASLKRLDNTLGDINLADISTAMQEIWEFFNANVKVDEFCKFCAEIASLTSTKIQRFATGRYQTVVNGDIVTITDTKEMRGYSYHGTLAQLKSDSEKLMYSVYIAANQEDSSASVRFLNNCVDAAKTRVIEQKAGPRGENSVYPTEFEFGPVDKQKPSNHRLGSITSLQHQFNVRYERAGIQKKDSVLLMNTAVAEANRSKVGGKSEGRLVAYVTPDRIENVWKTCQDLVQQGAFSEIKCFLLDATNKIRPNEHIDDYCIVFYVQNFYGGNIAEEAITRLKEERVIDHGDQILMLDHAEPDKAKWIYPHEIPSLDGRNQKIESWNTKHREMI